MSILNSSISLNITFVRPQFFYINGLENMPGSKIYYVFLSFVFVVSVLANSFVMLIINIEHSFHTPKHMAFFNLALADVGQSTALIPNLMAMFLFDSQYISYNACLSNMFFMFFFTTLQSVTLTVLAYDRVIAICLPLRYHGIVTMQAMAVILTVAWAYNSVFIISSVILITRLSFCKSIVVRSFFCDHGPMYVLACNDNFLNRVMAFVDTFFLLVLPFCLTILSYVFIAGALFKIASLEGRLKAIRTCSAHLMLVAVYYLPILGTYVTSLVVSTPIPRNIWIISISFAAGVTPMLNPIIYVMSTAEVKDFTKKLFEIK